MGDAIRPRRQRGRADAPRLPRRRGADRAGRRPPRPRHDPDGARPHARVPPLGGRPVRRRGPRANLRRALPDALGDALLRARLRADGRPRRVVLARLRPHDAGAVPLPPDAGPLADPAGADRAAPRLQLLAGRPGAAHDPVGDRRVDAGAGGARPPAAARPGGRGAGGRRPAQRRRRVPARLVAVEAAPRARRDRGRPRRGGRRLSPGPVVRGDGARLRPRTRDGARPRTAATPAADFRPPGHRGVRRPAAGERLRRPAAVGAARAAVVPALHEVPAVAAGAARSTRRRCSSC